MMVDGSLEATILTFRTKKGKEKELERAFRACNESGSGIGNEHE